ncbi:hypothetical protein L7F22_026292 [Adiantum nelumboides]|nr:hypothetical protein [Adiantum nelumboides]
MNRFSTAAPTTTESHVGISFPQQRKPSFQPIQPQIRPPSMAAGSGPLPFFSYDPSSAQTSTYSIPPSIPQHTGSFEDELPLLEELGINTTVILSKTLNILNPVRIKADLHEEADLAGPFVFVMLFGLFQLLAGKVQFGVILGWLAVTSLFLYFVFNMLAGRYGSLDLYRCVSFVGYCLLPMVIFSALQLFLPRSGPTAFIIACLAVIWCTRACTTLLLTASPNAEEQRSLIGYACTLIYTTFSLLIIF